MIEQDRTGIAYAQQAALFRIDEMLVLFGHGARAQLAALLHLARLGQAPQSGQAARRTSMENRRHAWEVASRAASGTNPACCPTGSSSAPSTTRAAISGAASYTTSSITCR